MKRIAIFASGTGSNTAKIIHYFKDKSKGVEIALIVSNKPTAKVLTIASDNNIATLILDKEIFFRGNAYLPQLQNASIDYIVLAGFLWKIPINLIQAYPKKIINIHPALLPKYGGKGMYGSYVHEAVIANKELESGITIHFVNEHYDEGEHIFKASCTVDKFETVESLAAKIHALEYEHFAKVIDSVVNKLQ